MELDSCDEIGTANIGVIVVDGEGHYYAITWDELRRFQIPPMWVAAVEALVHGAEPSERDVDLDDSADVRALSGDMAVLIDVLTAMKGSRPATQRLGAWALLR
ncbi:MAG: hypothetical protein AB7R89_14545 [Dehalococcoidia bacterium]